MSEIRSYCGKSKLDFGKEIGSQQLSQPFNLGIYPLYLSRLLKEKLTNRASYSGCFFFLDFSVSLSEWFTRVSVLSPFCLTVIFYFYLRFDLSREPAIIPKLVVSQPNSAALLTRASLAYIDFHFHLVLGSNWLLGCDGLSACLHVHPAWHPRTSVHLLCFHW